MKPGTLLTLLLILSYALLGQSRRITGILKEGNGKPIAQASILLKNSEKSVIGFSISNNAGGYSLPLPDSAKPGSVTLEIRCLGFKKIEVLLLEGRERYDLIMETEAELLKEVTVKNRPVIDRKGDTLSFEVAGFARPEDRSVGDVMKHMPGITVSEEGQISFNGKVISNLYIDNDNLMDGRYGLAPKVITKEMIKSVDVMQHHQPIKVLKDKVSSDDVAINLVLKDENSLKLSGQTMVGAGLPEQFDLGLNTMILNRKFKMLNSVKTNNSGLDYQDDFAQFGAANFLSGLGNTRPSTLLSTGTAGNPDLPKRNYNLNRTGVINANNLYNFKNGWQLRSNLQVYGDRRKFNYLTQVDQYLGKDTIRYLEEQQSIRTPFLVNTSFTATANKSNYFFNDNLRVNLSGDNFDSRIRQNNNSFDQNLFERVKDFSNDLGFTPLLRNKTVINFRWYLNYFTSPQTLSVADGIHADLLNNNQPFSATRQFAETPTFFSHASASFRFAKGPLSQSYQIGLINERQDLNSLITLTQLNGASTKFQGDAGNALQWRRDRIFMDASYYIKKTNWEASLSVPLVAQTIRYDQQEYGLNVKKNQVFSNPSLRLKYFVNAEDYFLAAYDYDNSVGNIAGVFRGIILSNYRSFRANDAELQEKKSSGPSLTYNFQRSIIMLFVNAGISYSKVKANSIFSSQLTNDIQRTILLPFENDQSSFAGNVGLSKYLFQLKTTASMKMHVTRSRFEQFINNRFLPFYNDALFANIVIDKKFKHGLTVNYSGSGTWNSSRLSGQDAGTLKSRVKRFDQNLITGYGLSSKLFFNIKARQIYSRQAGISDLNYVFVDAGLRYKMTSLRTDLEFDFSNLANIRKYELFQLSSSQFSYSSYEVRGRMAMVRATFMF